MNKQYRKYYQHNLKKIIKEYSNGNFLGTTTFLQDLAAALDLEIKFTDSGVMLSIFGSASLENNHLNGCLMVNQQLIHDYASLGSFPDQIFIRYLEYRLIVSVGRLLPLILTGGSEAEACMAGLSYLGYEDDYCIDLLGNKEFVDYIVAYRSGTVPDLDAYLKNIRVIYDTDYWDFLTEQEVEKIFQIVFDLLKRSTTEQKVSQVCG